MTTILITGANRGIGFALSEAYARDGAHVIACIRDLQNAAPLKGLAGAIRIEQLDVADPQSIAALARRLAGQSIDVLINNAGLGDWDRDIADVLNIDYDRFNDLITVNALGPMRLSAALYPNVKGSAEKKIIAISSRLGSIANNLDGVIPTYRASKAMLNQLMRSLAARSKADGFCVAVLNPGIVATDMGERYATISAAQSAAGLKQVIASLTPERSGSFLSYQGETLPW